MRKVFVELKVRLVINQDEDIETSEILDEMDYNFQSTTKKADIEDMDILDYEVTDSK